MLFPIRCFTCGKVLSDKWDEYKKRVDAGEDP
ncbi:MAG: DNA-directed RNA polymerase subunit N, partial [Thermoprotei archaeon]